MKSEKVTIIREENNIKSRKKKSQISHSLSSHFFKFNTKE